MQNDSSLNNLTINFSDVDKSYPGNPVLALSDVTFSVSQGEFFCIVGPSGCGKSTVLKIIAGLEESGSGTVKKPKEVSMVFQSGALLPWLTVWDNVALGLRAVDAAEKRIEQECSKYI